MVGKVGEGDVMVGREREGMGRPCCDVVVCCNFTVITHDIHNTSCSCIIIYY